MKSRVAKRVGLLLVAMALLVGMVYLVVEAAIASEVELSSIQKNHEAFVPGLMKVKIAGTNATCTLQFGNKLVVVGRDAEKLLVVYRRSTPLVAFGSGECRDEVFIFMKPQEFQQLHYAHQVEKERRAKEEALLDAEKRLIQDLLKKAAPK